MSTVDRLSALAKDRGESVYGRPENVDAALPQLASILAQSAEVDVIAATVVALGRAWDPRAVEMVLDRVAVDHPDATVRLEIARALPAGIDRHDACWARAVAALIRLSDDSASEVRDWACFGLGELQASSAAARDALALRLTDPHDDTRCEALRALAATGDDRALAAVRVRLAAADIDDIYTLELEAAAELADPGLNPLLLRLDEAWRGDADDHTPLLAFAIERCDPAARDEAEEVERALMTRIDQLLAVEPLIAGLTMSSAGRYPRTILTFHGPDGAPIPDAEVEVWDEQGPGSYELERTARQAVFTLKDTQSR